MPARKSMTIGERVAALTALQEAETKYQHDRWHNLDNKLQPVVLLPEKLAREIGKLHGVIDTRIGAISKDFEKSIEAAIAKANDQHREELKKAVKRIDDHDDDIRDLQDNQLKFTTTKIIVFWLLQSVVSIAGAVGAVYAIFEGKHP